MSLHLDALLDAERRAEVARHDEHQRAETRRILAGEPYTHPGARMSGDPADARRRAAALAACLRRIETGSSRFGELQ